MPSEGVYVPQGRSYFRDIPLPRLDGMEGQLSELEKTRQVFSAAVSLELWGMGLKNTEGTPPLALVPACTV